MGLLKKYRKLSNYQYIHGDFDGDGVPNIDDQRPFSKDSKRVNKEVSLSNTFKYLDKRRERAERYAKRLKNREGATSYRVKDNYSVINKLVHRNDFITNDYIGLRFETDKRTTGRMRWKRFNKDYRVPSKANSKVSGGEVFGQDNKYVSNKGNKNLYRAYHSNILYRPTKRQVFGLEAQFRTKKYGALNDQMHKDYKERKSLRKYKKPSKELLSLGY